MVKTIDQHIEEMRNVGDLLVPHSVPNVSFYEEREVDILKRRSIWIDGYHIAVLFSKSDFGKFCLESLEVSNLTGPFLPMIVACKVAIKFLGGHELKLSEHWVLGRKVYIWTIRVDKKGRPIPSEGDVYNYGNFTYCYEDIHKV